MERTPQEPVVFEEVSACSNLTTAPHEIYIHDHFKTMNVAGGIAVWNCQMTLDDAPVRDVLAQSETRLAENDAPYKPIVRDAALTYAWMCASALSDDFINFRIARNQVPQREYDALTPFSANLTTENMPFQAFYAQNARIAMGDPGSENNAGFAAVTTFCYGSLDIGISPDSIDSSKQENKTLYTFTPEQRMLLFYLVPGLEVWWRPEIGRIKVSRLEPEGPTSELLEADLHGDPYDVTTQLLGKFVLNNPAAA